MHELLSLSPDTLREILSLVEDRERIVKEIATVEAKLAKFGGYTVPATAPIAKTPLKASKPANVAKSTSSQPVKKAKRGSVKDAVIAALSTKPDGIAVSELAKIVGTSPASLHVFFNTTGKKTPGIERVGRGIYAYKEPASPAEAPKTLSIEANEPTVPVVEETASVEAQTVIEPESTLVEESASTESPLPEPAVEQDRIIVLDEAPAPAEEAAQTPSENNLMLFS